jgi:hypothetical protein
MAEVTADRVYETSTTTGTGSYTLAGAIAGYRAFSAVCANGDTVRCFVEEVDANGVPNGGWEVGVYTWGTGGVLARTTVEASSNAGAAVSWVAGTRRIGLGVTASKLTTPLPPNVQAVTSSATVTPTFSNDLVKVTAQAAALALANPTGTAVDGLGMVIRIKDNGTARAITYGTQYRALGVTLPTTTVVSKTLYLAMVYNADDTKWDVVAVGQEA